MTGGRVNRRDEGVARTRCHPSGPYKGLPGTFAVSTLWSGWNRSAIEPGPLRRPRDGPRDLQAAVLDGEGVVPGLVLRRPHLQDAKACLAEPGRCGWDVAVD